MVGKIIFQSKTYDLSPDGEWRDLPSDQDWLKSIHQTLEAWFDESDLMSLQSSGTTGTPKTITIQKSNMAVGAQLTAQHFELKQGTEALLCLPAAYIAGKMMLVRSIVNAWNLHLIPPSSAPLQDDLPSFDFAALTPMQFQKSKATHPKAGENIETIILGGASVSKALSSLLQHHPKKVFETYGMTETITHIATRKVNGENRSDYFTCLPGVKYTWDERRCLCIEAEHLPEKVITNDRIEPVDFTTFELLGRIDNLVNSGGVKIHPEQLETQLDNWFDVDFYFSGRKDPLLGQKLVLHLERPPLDARSEKLLMDSLRDELGSVKSPKEIIYHPEFKRTTSGKIIREKA